MACVVAEGEEWQDTTAWEFPHPVGTINIYENFLEAAIGGVVSAASVTLSRYLIAHPELVVGRRCVELGSGCGMVSMVAKRLGAQSIQPTDMKDFIPHVQANLDLNQVEGSVRPLVWGDEAQLAQLDPFDIALAAYCIYDFTAIEHFVSIMAACEGRRPFLVCGIAEPSSNSKSALAKSTLHKFLEACHIHKLSAHLISVDDIDPFKKYEDEKEEKCNNEKEASGENKPNEVVDTDADDVPISETLQRAMEEMTLTSHSVHELCGGVWYISRELSPPHEPLLSLVSN